MIPTLEQVHDAWESVISQASGMAENNERLRLVVNRATTLTRAFLFQEEPPLTALDAESCIVPVEAAWAGGWNGLGVYVHPKQAAEPPAKE